MKHASDIIWKLAISLVAFGMAAEIAVGFLAPHAAWIVGFILIFVVVFVVTGLRNALRVKGGHGPTRRRGRD